MKTALKLFGIVTIVSVFYVFSVSAKNADYPVQVVERDRTAIEAHSEIESGYLKFKNMESSDLSQCTFHLNKGIFDDGYFVEVPKVKSNKSVSIPVSEFANSKGERFSVLSLKPKTITVKCLQNDLKFRLYMADFH